MVRIRIARKSRGTALIAPIYPKRESIKTVPAVLQDLKTACTALDIEVLQTEIKHIDRIRSLPRYKDHGDPFDRLIICQALSEKLPLITSDGKMSRYGVQVIW